jgi:hypothetical protein
MKTLEHFNTLDHLALAVKRALVYGETELGSYFVRCMDDAAKLKFDGWLVQTKHRLAWEAGSPESRFKTVAKRMLDLERDRLAQ